MSDAKKGDAKAEAAHAPAEKGGGGGSKLLPILVGVNSLLLVGVMVFMVLQMQKQQAAMMAAMEGLSHGSPAAKGDDHGGKEPPREEPKEEPREEKKAEGGEGGEGKGEGKGEGGEGKAGPKGAVMVKLPDFVVHLRNPDADRYARMSFEVEVYGDSDKDRITGALPRVRDAFISYLSDRTLEDLRGSEGLARTKDSLQTTLRQICPDARIRGLYIADFVVQ